MFTLNQKTTTEKRYILNRDELLAVTKDLNFGLVPNDLLVLLNMYQITQEIIKDVPDEEYKMIEMGIRNNIIEGYQKYRKLLRVDKNKSTIAKFEDNEIKFHL